MDDANRSIPVPDFLMRVMTRRTSLDQKIYYDRAADAKREQDKWGDAARRSQLKNVRRLLRRNPATRRIRWQRTNIFDDWAQVVFSCHHARFFPRPQ